MLGFMGSYPPHWGSVYGRQAAALGFADAVCRQNVEEVAKLVMVWRYHVRLKLAGDVCEQGPACTLLQGCIPSGLLACLYSNGAQCKITLSVGV